MIEMLKVVTGSILKRPISDFKSTFANLALPVWIQTEPFEPKRNKSVDFDPIVGGPVRARPEGFTSWDKFTIQLPS